MTAQQLPEGHNIPQHVSIIMDGNGRWAKRFGLQRIFGHRSGVEAVRAATEAAAELGVKFLTLYAFSTENWSRPKSEVNALMSLLADAIETEAPTLQRNNIKFTTIGDISALPEGVQAKLQGITQATEGNSGLTLVVAINYSGRWDIVSAAKKMCAAVEQGALHAADVNEKLLAAQLSTSQMPDPDLFIRTGGDLRVSNFLLWQIAYSELYFTPVLWPDFKKHHFVEAVQDFQKRERRFGAIAE
jgi:undecaprenyl diphosphate synthase